VTCQRIDSVRSVTGGVGILDGGVGILDSGVGILTVRIGKNLTWRQNLTRTEESYRRKGIRKNLTWRKNWGGIGFPVIYTYQESLPRDLLEITTERTEGSEISTRWTEGFSRGDSRVRRIIRRIGELYTVVRRIVRTQKPYDLKYYPEVIIALKSVESLRK
jgi:hypothetical protein